MELFWKQTTVAALLLTVVMAGHAQSARPAGNDTVCCMSSASETGQSEATDYSYAPPVALKTNLLYDAFLVTNLGVEVSLGKQWSVTAEWFGAWVSRSSTRHYWQGYGGYLTLRRYFPRRSQCSSPQRPRPTNFTGHHVGVYLLGLTYDVEWGGRGYQADHFGFGGGVEYGYSLPIGYRLNLDFTIGIGFQDGEYKEYDPKDGHFVWQSTRKRHWFGPTKAEVSLVCLIGK